MAAQSAGVTLKVAVQSSRRLLRDALSACLSIRPDVTVVGKVAEPVDVLDLCELARLLPELNLIVAYRDAHEQDLVAACRAGITSLVPESHGLAAVLALLRRSPGRHARPSAGGLTDCELELIVLTGSGHGVSEIASLLRISPLTVENLKRRVYAKMGVNSSAHARPGPRRSACSTGPRYLPGGGRCPALTSRCWPSSPGRRPGHSIRRTAQVLGIAPKTVENIQTRLFRKLGVRNRSGLVRDRLSEDRVAARDLLVRRARAVRGRAAFELARAPACPRPEWG